jgi:ribosomal protein L11 methyltransferase
MDTDINTIIMECLSSSDRKLTQPDLERMVSKREKIERKKIRQAVRSLLGENRIVYTYEMGCSFLTPSFGRPVRVGSGVVLAPPGISFRPVQGEILVRIAPGAAFGIGDHPTTRLALGLTAWAVMEAGWIAAPETVRGLDIGTGSGVLAVAAARMGVGSVVGLDTDPCARAEAAENIRLNGLSDRVSIGLSDIDRIDGRFGLILANLRYPTLARLAGRIGSLAGPEAVLVFSGLREEEAPPLLEVYGAAGFRLLRQRSEKGWVGLALGGQKSWSRSR